MSKLPRCMARESWHIESFTLPVTDCWFRNDTLLCDGSTVTLDVTNSGIIYLCRMEASIPHSPFFCSTYWRKSRIQIRARKLTRWLPLMFPFLCLISVTILWFALVTHCFKATAPGVTYHWNNAQQTLIWKFILPAFTGKITDAITAWYWYLQSCVLPHHLLISAVKFIIVWTAGSAHATTPGGISFCGGWSTILLMLWEYPHILVTVTNAIGCKGYIQHKYLNNHYPSCNLSGYLLVIMQH